MADCEKITELYTEVKEREVFVLRLSQKEAEMLVSVLGKVDGSPEETTRKYSESVYNALYKFIYKDYDDYWSERGRNIRSMVEGSIQANQDFK